MKAHVHDVPSSNRANMSLSLLELRTYWYITARYLYFVFEANVSLRFADFLTIKVNGSRVVCLYTIAQLSTPPELTAITSGLGFDCGEGRSKNNVFIISSSSSPGITMIHSTSLMWSETQKAV